MTVLGFLASGHSFPSDSKVFLYKMFFSKSASFKYCPGCGAAKHISNSGEIVGSKSSHCLHKPHVVDQVFDLQIFPFPALKRWGSKPSHRLLHNATTLKASFENPSWYAIEKTWVPFPKDSWYESPAGKREVKGNWRGRDWTRKAWGCYKKPRCFCFP